MKPTELIKAVISTLSTIKTDDTDGNWSKLLGCKQALQKVLEEMTAQVESEEKPTE